ncbi:protein SRC2-like [Cornus florida]|uniref:protein SRC2-like n=1 Tax=Cornus florida TaxID=4283 RepID=UPI0028A1884F|nr:protein SRC2-like [Cornus florida]
MDCIKPREEMDCTDLEINLISASHLKPVGKLSRMKVYARVSIGGAPMTSSSSEKRTPVDNHGKTNPAWNFTTIHTIDKSAVQNECRILVIKLYSKRFIMRDRYIGEVHVSLKELYKRASNGSKTNTVEYQVKKGSEYSNGMLKFSYMFIGTKADHEHASFWARTVSDAAMLFFKVFLNYRFKSNIPI